MTVTPKSDDSELESRASSFPPCLILHGLGGGPYELEPLITALREHDCVVQAPTLPGHDGQGPRMPHSTWPDWSRAVTEVFDSISNDGQDVAVIGFSTGGTLALELASRRSVSRLVLLAPFLSIRYIDLIPFRPTHYLRWLAKVLPDLPRRPPAVRDASSRRRAAEADRYHTFSMHSAVSALDLIDTVKPLVPDIKAPTLIIQGLRDTVVDPSGADWLYDQLGSSDKTLMRLEHSDHLVALDEEREQVIAAILEFLSRGSAQ